LKACQEIVAKNGGGLCFMLGTGSSMSIIQENKALTIPSLGYLLGDEGSGLDIVKRILVKYPH